MDFRKEAAALGIGDTPLIRHENEFEADIFIKVESMNASGSVKDRPALGMILAAEEAGVLKKGDTIVEATSGNMGIALAYVGLKRGYNVKLTMPDTMTVERRQILQGLGAELVLTDGKLGMKGAIDAAKELASKPRHAWLKQFENEANVAAHYLSTGVEILEQLDKVDVLVAGVGTGGTLVGTGRRLREKFPQCEIVAVEPAASPVISKGQKGAHAIQGIGAGFVTDLYDAELVNRVETVTDEEALEAFYELNLKLGYCCGISSAANLVVACRLAQNPAYKGKNIVTLFPDGDDRYQSLLAQRSE